MTPQPSRSSLSPNPSNQNGSERSSLLTADELAARWQISKAAVYRLSRDRAIPCVPLGRYYRYRLPSIEAWEAAQEAGADE